MRITPLDARKQEFRKAVRGFDCDEVRAFLSTLADEYETVLVDNKQLRERVMEQEDKIVEYKTMETTLRDTLMTAERLMQDTRDNASKEGDLIVKDAHLKSRQVLEECRVRTEELRRELVGLRKEKENYLARFKSLAESQIQFIDSHRNDFEDLDKRLVGLADSVLEGVSEPVPQTAPFIRPATPTPAPQAAPVYEARDAVEPTAEPAPAPAPVAAVKQEHDIWRDYQPEAGNETADEAPAETAQPTAEPVPEANPWAARETWDNGDQVTDPNRQEQHGDQSPEQQDAPAAAVDLAAMGIPVPAVPRADEADVAVAALTEDQEPQPEVHTVF